ncbi:DUF4390 domain-containing protein [Desulfospira joergensenii]|uniref:DUF4390 domain-containing protein n=1 Tax=Desulfospira joergensenii TaxID=53329 RepID=UPI001294662A|nr:DUF4390 domain-containing protein [Desulfospira joergensenii]
MKSFLIYPVLFICLMMPRTTLADNTATLANIKLANTRDDLLTYFEVRNAFTDKITQAVHNGVPTTFSFYVSLYQTSDSWLDKKIAEVRAKSTVKYNSLKKEYTVSRPWKNEKPSATQSFEEAKSWMTEIDNLKIIPLENLKKGGKYQIRIKAELDKVTLPLSLHNIFFFVSFWDVKTDWYLVNFTY